MEFLYNGATYITLLVKKIFFPLLKFAILFKNCVYVRKTAIAFETSCLYNVVYVFLLQWERSF